MARVTTFGIGGFIAAHPSQNRVQELDSVANTFTTWDAAGTQTEQRALTPAEQSALADQTAQATAEANAVTLKSRATTALATNATYLAQPALPAGAALTTTQLTSAIRILRAQVDALTKQNDALIRLALGLLDDISDS